MKLLLAPLPATNAHAAVRFAASELRDHLAAARPGLEFGQTRVPDRAQFVLATFDDLNELDGPRLGDGLTNDHWVDRVIVRSDGERVILAGANPRSVLFAVYTYLESLGFAWFMPGDEGRIVPKLDTIPLTGYAIDHTPPLIYRGSNMCGAYTVEHGEQFVEWLARNRLNHLYLGGATRRANFVNAAGERPSRRVAERWDMRLVRAAKQRGMIVERMGHGWTDRVLGLKEHGQPAPQSDSEDRLAMVAELDGERAIRRNTQLCLSHPDAAERMGEVVVRYALDHPEIDVLAVWMADGFNNWCECAQCRTQHPSDQWVRLINHIADAMHSARPDVRVQFLGYASLMEPPTTERIDNRHGNVIFMYAPFHRCYQHAMDDPACVLDQPLQTFPPANRLIHPGNADYFRFLKGWLDKHDGTNYIFDYYAWLPIKRDFFAGHIPRAMAEDLTRYPRHSVQGMVDCARVDSFWPTPLLRWMQTRASWDSTTDYETEYHRLLELVYRAHAPIVDRYLTLAYACLLPDVHGRAEERDFHADKVERFRKELPEVRAELARAIDAADGVVRRMLERVDVHARYTLMQMEQLLAEAHEAYDESMEWARRMHALAQDHAALLAGAADAPELAWLESDTIRRLEHKKAGEYPTRIERNAFGETRNGRIIEPATA